MGWSRHCHDRAAEAAARTTAMERIGYLGRIDDDGYPLDGPNARRPFQSPVRNPWDRHHLAVDAAEAGYYGGAQNSGDPHRPWPRGYRPDGDD